MENGETLLHLFYERQGKRHTDYSRHTPIAQIRLQELKGGIGMKHLSQPIETLYDEVFTLCFFSGN